MPGLPFGIVVTLGGFILGWFASKMNAWLNHIVEIGGEHHNTGACKLRFSTLGLRLCHHWNLYDPLLVIWGVHCWHLVYVWLMGSLGRSCISKGINRSFDRHDHSTCHTIFSLI